MYIVRIKFKPKFNGIFIIEFFSKSGVDGDINISKKENNNEKHGRRMCSYILQDDNLFPLFTVQETMEQAADLKLDNVSIKEKQKLVSDSSSQVFLISVIKQNKNHHFVSHIPLL